MIKSTLTAATLAMLLAGPAFADDDDDRRRRGDRDDRYDHRYDDRRHDRDYDRRHDNRRADKRRHDNRRADKRRHDNRDWGRDRGRRHVPPARYRADFGYRSAYEQAWSDWLRYGRHDRNWRRYPSRYRIDLGYRSGYDSGWRDAARYYGHGYRPGRWLHDPRGGWYFGFHIVG
jgi:hypothetical protein